MHRFHAVLSDRLLAAWSLGGRSSAGDRGYRVVVVRGSGDWRRALNEILWLAADASAFRDFQCR